MQETLVNSLISFITAIEYNWVAIWGPLFFSAGAFGFTPFKPLGQESTLELLAIRLRGVIIVAIPTVLIILSTAIAMLVEFSEVHHLGTVKTWIGQMVGESTGVIALGIAGYSMRLIYMRWIVPTLSAMKKSTAKELDKDSLSNIEEEIKKYAKKTYNPRKHYKPGLIFVGLDVNEKPVYLTYEEYKIHKEIVGASGFGKGVIIGLILDQIISSFSSTASFVVDPKDDKFLAHVLYQACQKAGREFVYISFDGDEPGRWGPFFGGNFNNARTRFTNCFDMYKKGSDGDHFTLQDRKVMNSTLMNVRHLVDISNAFQESLPDGNTAMDLIDWTQNKTFTCSEEESFSIEEAVRLKKVVYVKTDLEDEIMLKASTAFITEIAQVAKRLKHEYGYDISAYYDEVSFYIDPALPRQLSAVRDMNMDIAVIFQYREQLLQINHPVVTGESVLGAVKSNCQVKFMFGGSDGDTADNLSAETGTVPKKIRSMDKVELNEIGAEVWENTSYVATKEEALIHKNTVLAMPKGVCIFKKPGALAHLLFPSFVPVTDMEALNRHIEKLKAEELANTPSTEDNNEKEPPSISNDSAGDNPFLS